jgi:ribose transport system substrate-binding protein
MPAQVIAARIQFFIVSLPVAGPFLIPGLLPDRRASIIPPEASGTPACRFDDMTHTRRLAAVLLAATLACAVTGCRQPPGGRAGARMTIAVIPKGSTHEFWKAVHAGALGAAREERVDILWQGPLKEDDREEQIKVVDTIRARGVSGIVLAPLDDKALRVPVADAVRAGIPVAIFDSDLASDDYVTFAATDNYKGGRLAGEHMARLLDDKGAVIMLRLHEGSASTTKREQGFLDAIAGHRDIKVVSSNQYAGATTEGAYRASENLLAATRAAEGAVDGIFTVNESSTFGMLRALENAKLAGRVKFVGFDTSEKSVQALAAGEIDALVVQNPAAMGYQAVKMLVHHLRGERVPKVIDTGVTLVTRANMREPAIAALIHPDLSILDR